MIPQYKIRMIKFYQAVTISGGPETYYTAPEYVTARRDGKQNYSISVNDKGVILESDSDVVMVGWPNVCAVYFDKSKPLVATSESETDKKPSKKVDFRNI